MRSLRVICAKRRALRTYIMTYIHTLSATTAESQPRETPCLARPRIPGSPSPTHARTLPAGIHTVMCRASPCLWVGRCPCSVTLSPPAGRQMIPRSHRQDAPATDTHTHTRDPHPTGRQTVTPRKDRTPQGPTGRQRRHAQPSHKSTHHARLRLRISAVDPILYLLER